MADTADLERRVQSLEQELRSLKARGLVHPRDHAKHHKASGVDPLPEAIIGGQADLAADPNAVIIWQQDCEGFEPGDPTNDAGLLPSFLYTISATTSGGKWHITDSWPYEGTRCLRALSTTTTAPAAGQLTVAGMRVAITHAELQFEAYCRHEAGTTPTGSIELALRRGTDDYRAESRLISLRYLNYVNTSGGYTQVKDLGTNVTTAWFRLWVVLDPVNYIYKRVGVNNIYVDVGSSMYKVTGQDAGYFAGIALIGRNEGATQHIFAWDKLIIRARPL